MVFHVWVYLEIEVELLDPIMHLPMKDICHIIYSWHWSCAFLLTLGRVSKLHKMDSQVLHYLTPAGQLIFITSPLHYSTHTNFCSLNEPPSLSLLTSTFSLPGAHFIVLASFRLQLRWYSPLGDHSWFPKSESGANVPNSTLCLSPTTLY